ncbi:hypothetical protein FOE78_13385 [Microlunatus elymi]|uniref:Solute-binding protein family 5 domain-containing protein n=1 Tax=Microlunatus elymi TaxID=2596828 RepID=A0A516Q044_9ACTN|nr:ABC transporter substrate-binding protein [Microlunatus elymi]QDP96767.1 hypothetical protein FOE78_13385 [Microlunatus elymi]
MRTEPLRPGRRGPVAMIMIIAMLIMTSGCTGHDQQPAPSPSATASVKRAFTVMTTDKEITADPAAVHDTASTMLTQNVFQRLVTASPTDSYPEPDAAQECRFPTKTSYVCTLRPNLKFSNGDPLTSADVKFSIERATRLDVAGSSAPQLSSLRRIETPNPTTVQFVLSQEDTQFPWALASPAASIVDSKVYNSDHVRPMDEPVVGSGPYEVSKISKNLIEFTRYTDYIGYAAGKVDTIELRTMPDSASIEEAMAAHEVDVVWRGLSAAAQQRLHTQIGASRTHTSKAGFSQTVLPGARVEQLLWNPRSKHVSSTALRDVIAAALQEDRTLDSVVPNGVPGHHSSFPLGGKAKIDVSWNSRIHLTLGYDPTAPNSLDLATQLRIRLENTGGMSVLLRADDPDADLQLVDRKAWTSTGIAWLQPIIDHPLRGEAKPIDAALANTRQAGVGTPQLNTALAQLQQIAAKENLVLPISQAGEDVYSGPRASVTPDAFGPGWQLGLWGLKEKQ